MKKRGSFENTLGLEDTGESLEEGEDEKVREGRRCENKREKEALKRRWKKKGET